LNVNVSLHVSLRRVLLQDLSWLIVVFLFIDLSDYCSGCLDLEIRRSCGGLDALLGVKSRLPRLGLDFGWLL